MQPTDTKPTGGQSADPTRRDFVKKSALALGSFMIVPRHVLGKGFLAPSDKLNVAAVGSGGKGAENINRTWNNGTDNIVALCDVDDRMAKDMRAKFPNAKYYKDYRVMFDKERKNFDAVLVSTPDHTHAVVGMAAMQMGKHLYCEKPLTHSIAEARMMTEAARKYKVVTQMGNHGSSGEGIRQMQEWYTAGVMGDVAEVHVWTDRPVWPQGVPSLTGKYPVPPELDFDLWLGPAPVRDFHPDLLPFKWRGWWEYGTGALGDMGCHLIDVPFRTLGLGYPTEVSASVSQVYFENWKSAELADSCPTSAKITFKFAGKAGKPDVKLTWYDGGLQPELPEELGVTGGLPTNGVIFVGTKNKVMGELFGSNPRLLPESKMASFTQPTKTIARVERNVEGHQQNWVTACKAGYGKGTTSSSFDFAGPLTETVLMGNLAVRSYNMRLNGKNPGRKKLLWDGAAMRITNFDEANQLVRRQTYRSGFALS